MGNSRLRKTTQLMMVIIQFFMILLMCSTCDESCCLRGQGRDSLYSELLRPDVCEYDHFYEFMQLVACGKGAARTSTSPGKHTPFHTVHFSKDGFNIPPLVTSDLPLPGKKTDFKILEVWELFIFSVYFMLYGVFWFLLKDNNITLLTPVIQNLKTVLSDLPVIYNHVIKNVLCFSYIPKDAEDKVDDEKDLYVKVLISEVSKGREKSEILKEKPGIDHWIWSRNPFDWFKVSREQQVYSLFDQQFRLASYRPLLSQDGSNSFSYVTLSDAGFYYSGAGNRVCCFGCRREVNITDFRSDPTDRRYHCQGCQFIQGSSEGQEAQEISIPNAEGDESDEGFNEAEIIESDSVPFTQSEISVPPGSAGPAQNNADKDSHTPCSSGDNKDNHTPYSGANPVASGSDVNSEDEEENTVEPLPSETAELASSSAREPPCSGRKRNSSDTSADSGFSEGAAAGASAGASSSSGNSTAYSETPPDSGLLDDDISSPEHSNITHTSHLRQDDFKATCKKNPGHFAYNTMPGYSLNHVPSNARFPDVLKFLKVCADLTVRIVVNTTSKQRANGDPIKENSEEGKSRTGTGNAFDDHEDLLKPKSAFKNRTKWKTVKKYVASLTKEKQGMIFIETNRHLVYNDEEAEATTVDFFYDTPDRKGVVTVKGHCVLYSTLLGSTKAILVCRTGNLKLVESLNKKRQEMKSLVNGFPQNVKEGLMRRLFVISHPHGAEKVLSYGEFVLVKYLMAMDERLVKINSHQQANHPLERLRKVLLYTADTCEGSSGAPVIMFRKCVDEIQMEVWTHNGVDTNHGLNGSVMKACLESDLSRYAYTSPRENRQNDLNNDPNDLGNQPIGSPVYTVLGHPSHPMYIAYEKRLESLANWESTHIHTREELAFAGFFYAGYGDCVRCFQCGLGLRSWKPNDDLYAEHERHRPSCQFLQMQLRARGGNRDGAETAAPSARGNTDNNGKTNETYSKINVNGQNSQQQEPNDCTKFQEVRTSSVIVPAFQEVTVGMALNEAGPTSGALNMTPEPNTAQGAMSHAPAPARAPNPALEEPEENGKSLALRVLRNENERLQKQLKCKVCFNAPIKDLFLPCGELYACTDCSKLLTHCPSCKKKILATVTTYLT